ncbi:peroxiredoxin [Lysobacter solisilvae (ex Woo and Kim 2020)]|uniref:thioredoxin-dependent peroxiredoxin n=1 Tax=Agrilutibacter terrestris TaxID=2865112 RepID=A0A7H0FWZ8_9GAMM|nr:peroxiredoxin [Lysobacter terrestris]QNP40564.1 peroxiredoxin [Lysobacter terrestris]
MKSIKLAVVGAIAAVAFAAPSLAALKAGAKAPDFSASAYLAGKPFTYKLSDALKKGPVVVYFFPAAHTPGCNIEARQFSQAIDKFKAQGATVIGITAGNVDELADFSRETEHCGGKFPVAADPGAAIAKQYDAILDKKPEWSSRTSYVIARNGAIAHAYSDLNPARHVQETLAAVKALKK